MGRRRALLLVIGGAFGAAQLVRFAEVNPPTGNAWAAPVAIEPLLRNACYDCHSNHTARPWYGEIAPLSWLIQRDVIEGRRRLNFSDWADYASDPGTLSQKLSEISRSVTSGEMPPWYYRALHSTARLTAAERDRLTAWADHERDRQPSIH
jgi:hypothetical protein